MHSHLSSHIAARQHCYENETKKSTFKRKETVVCVSVTSLYNDIVFVIANYRIPTFNMHFTNTKFEICVK